MTKAFHRWYETKRTTCVPKASQWGICATSHQMTEKDLADSKMNVDSFRKEIFLDWQEFHYNPFALYYVEKDIPNTVKSRFLQSLFGIERTAFVFTMRHPMSICRDFVCDAPIEDFIQSWLQVYRTLEQDLPFLKTYVLLHSEGILDDTQEVFSTVCDIVGYNEIRYLSEQGRELTVDCKMRDKVARRRLGYHGTTLNDTGAVVIFTLIKVNTNLCFNFNDLRRFRNCKTLSNR